MKIELLFPKHLRTVIRSIGEWADLEEIRIRIGQPMYCYTSQKEFVLVYKAQTTGEKNYLSEENERNVLEFRESVGKYVSADSYRVCEADMMEMQNYISNYSLYAWQEELKNGFLTILGGHRIGIAGSTTNLNGHVNGLSYLTFLNIRIAHERKGCATQIMPYIYQPMKEAESEKIYNTLMVSAPGVGKTTLLRDCIRNLSYAGKNVALVDERSEIAASYQGIPQNDVGPRTDVLDGCNKPEGIQMLLRSMAPDIIAVDELGNEKDFLAVEQAAYSGCRLLGTVHAGSVHELKEKEILKRWCQRGLFERFVLIEKHRDGMRSYQVYNDRWEQL